MAPIHLASQLPFAGEIDIVDKQDFGDENLGTCILIGLKEVTKSKTVTMAEHLKQHGIRSRGFPEEFGKYAERLIEYPSIVLNGLDNIDVRHEVQRALWPDVIIDGAIGDFMCQVSPALVASRHCMSDLSFSQAGGGKVLLKFVVFK